MNCHPKIIRRYSDKRLRKINSRTPLGYATVFRRVIKTGFGKDIRAEIYPVQEGYQLFVFYLEGKKKQLPEKYLTRLTPLFRRKFLSGVLNCKRRLSPITYFRCGIPSLPVACIVRKCTEINKKFAYEDADRVAADIVSSFSRKCRITANDCQSVI